MNRFRLSVFAMATVLALGACQSVPYARLEDLPPAVQPQDGSAERHALNARVYDAATSYVGRLFYRRDFGGLDWPAEAAARRAQVVSAESEADFYLGLKALIDRLNDDHTNVHSPTSRARIVARRRGEQAAGHGFEVRPEGDARWVSRVTPDSPAALAGIEPGWQVISIDGGPPHLGPSARLGDATTFVFESRDGRRHTHSLVGAEVPSWPRRSYELRDDGVAVVRFDDFDPPTLEWADGLFADFAVTPPRGLVIDLRTNGGGYFNITALMLAHLFDRSIEVAEWDGRLINRRWRADGSATPYRGPVAVLTGPASASGAEVFAAVVREEGRGKLIGETTRGAVIGTRTIDLPDGGALSVGMIDMITPDGDRIEGHGVAPDLAVPNDWDAVLRGDDLALDAAIAVVTAEADTFSR
ncbi:S41 family peptidase [Brevundimonas lutea]|uniref:S41 family peptidase n=1 Tax=Brevundimonas lutea TaxID=2293980 RepID=UPI000F044B8F|nr:S41 family peptidase [Brevundimonas lutea]